MLALVFTVAAETARPDRADELDALRARIAKVQQGLDQAREERDEVRADLRDVEREIGTLLRGLKKVNDALAVERRRLEQLQRRQRDRQAVLARQHRELAQHARVAYMLGREEPLKLLLNQEDPARASRMLAYHRYFAQSRAARIADLEATLRELAELEPGIQARAEALAKLRDEQLAQKRGLDRSRARERALLAQIGRRIETRTRQIARLREDEARLARLVAGVRASLSEVPAFTPSGARFGDHKGRLPLPLPGRIAAAFGKPRQKGELKWKGVFLGAKPGQDVRSVFPGRVVYADWLQGFGLLLILEHGEGYMTLYGHGQSLYKKVGDWVEAGEVIGQAGRTGAFSGAGLYFEIRHNGEPRNPLEWCRRAS